MRRAMATGVPGLPDRRGMLDEVLLEPLVDLHQVVTSQIQTAGPAGLKVVATEAGFSWRDDAPSGEASMAWYEEARGDRRRGGARRRRNASSPTTRTTASRPGAARLARGSGA